MRCRIPGRGHDRADSMVRRGKFKYITVNNYPPQLFDLATDPEESTNVAGHGEYAAAESGLRKRAEAEWDGSALKNAVLANQRERQVVQSTAKPKWDFESAIPGPYRL